MESFLYRNVKEINPQKKKPPHKDVTGVGFIAVSDKIAWNS
jgi:hypothetical protein